MKLKDLSKYYRRNINQQKRLSNKDSLFIDKFELELFNNS